MAKELDAQFHELNTKLDDIRFKKFNAFIGEALFGKQVVAVDATRRVKGICISADVISDYDGDVMVQFSVEAADGKVTNHEHLDKIVAIDGQKV